MSILSALVVALALLAPAPPRGFVCGDGHRPPVTAPVTDPFRPPAQPWLPGNRGLEYGTEPGDIVAASSGGRVVYSGAIGDGHFVTVDHGCELRTTYSFLGGRRVAQGGSVSRGQAVGEAGPTRFHFGALWRGVYIDPELLFSHRLQRVVRLVE